MRPTTLPPLWRQRVYLLLWGANALGIVVQLLMLQMTGSASAAGLASALGVVPDIVLSLPVGVWVDRWDRKRVMVCCDAGRAAVDLAVVLALWLGVLTPNWLYAVALVQGTLVVFFNLAEVAVLPKVVATAQLADAIGQNQAAHSGATIAGPALGTWLLQHAGPAMPFGVNALGHVHSALCLWPLCTPLAAAPPAAHAAFAPRWRSACAGCGGKRWCATLPCAPA